MENTVPTDASNEPPVFTAHRIRLPGGSEIGPAEHGLLVADSPWFLRSLAIIRLALGDDLTDKSIIDLGCLEGGYTAAFAQAGFRRALGIDVRRANIQACMFVQSRIGLPNLEFALGDVWKIAQHGTFDAAFCCGLLYHLDRPAQFLRLLGDVVSRVVVINTHIAHEGVSNPVFNLSELTEHEGLPGRWYPEHAIDDEAKLDAAHRWSSWSNRRSFWLTRAALAHAVRASGFDLVFEQFDCHTEIGSPDLVSALRSGYYATHDRAVFVGVRTSTTANKPGRRKRNGIPRWIARVR